MRSILFSTCFHSEVILIFSVTPNVYQSPYSMLIIGSYKHSAIPELSLNPKCQDVLVQYTQGYNDQGSDALEIMLNINMECSRAYVQHFQLYFHVFHIFMFNTNVSTHVPQSLSLNKNNLIDHALQGPRPTQKISSIMCFKVHTQQKTYTYKYIINNWLTPNIQNKS